MQKRKHRIYLETNKTRESVESKTGFVRFWQVLKCLYIRRLKSFEGKTQSCSSLSLKIKRIHSKGNIFHTNGDKLTLDDLDSYVNLQADCGYQSKQL